MEPGFEWDQRKAAANQHKHGVSFDEAASTFTDAFALVRYDPDHSMTEDRLILTGLSSKGRLLTVIHTDRPGRTRIISARLASKTETAAYAKAR
jgi:uncharacterized protein